MASIFPFRALRYNPASVKIEDVVTQPYDKISPAMQQKYYDKSPYNLVRVILGKSEPGDTDSNNVYTRAAADLAAWRKKGVLKEEADPAVYAYSQTYQVPGSDEIRERRGFIALGQLYDYAEQVIYRHEQTLSKPKSDRLNLFKATRAYCEQILPALLRSPNSPPTNSSSRTTSRGRGPRRVRRHPPSLEDHRPEDHHQTLRLYGR